MAQVARNYAQQCNWAHNPARTTDTKALTSQFSYVGENLYATSVSKSFKSCSFSYLPSTMICILEVFVFFKYIYFVMLHAYIV